MAAPELGQRLHSAMNPKNKRPSWVSIIGSVLAAFFGVQSSRNRERDFGHGNWRVYLLAGILLAGLFVFGLLMLVKLVLKYTAG